MSHDCPTPQPIAADTGTSERLWQLSQHVPNVGFGAILLIMSRWLSGLKIPCPFKECGFDPLLRHHLPKDFEESIEQETKFACSRWLA